MRTLAIIQYLILGTLMLSFGMGLYSVYISYTTMEYLEVLVDEGITITIE